MGRFNLYAYLQQQQQHDDDDDDENDSEEEGCEDDGDEQEEWPHPLPLDYHWGRTKFSPYPPRRAHSNQKSDFRNYRDDDFLMDHHGDDTYDSDGSEEENRHLFLLSPQPVQLPPLSTYRDSSIVSLSALHSYQKHHDQQITLQSRQEEKKDERYNDSDDDMDTMLQLLQDCRISSSSPAPSPPHETALAKIAQKYAIDYSNQNDKLQKWKEGYQQRRRQQYKDSCRELKAGLKSDVDTAKEYLQKEKTKRQQKEAQQQLERQQKAREEQQAKEKQQQKEAQQKKQQQPETNLTPPKDREAPTSKPHAKSSAAPTSSPPPSSSSSSSKGYAAKALKLVSQLRDLRASVHPFDQSKAVSKRRLRMKKLCKGKVNTLAADVHKVQTVAAELVQAIQEERNVDEQIKQQLEQNTPGVTPEMAKGKRYFVDLLASTAIVRIQAEGFNGPRGDGFPLAAFLAAVSNDVKDIVPVFSAHIYTVCPTAIPSLPQPSPDATQEQVMESLGMIKDTKTGEFETFERFLTRTEGIISIVAEIMASHPSSHPLFGGHKTAPEWLSRFLALLPPSPQQLPLLTAPVLNAFLIGAGHMMAKVYPDQFKKHLKVIMEDIVTRLDEGKVGASRAHRLKETVKGGFGGFQKELPSKALAPLYFTGESAPPPLPLKPLGQTNPSSNNPFGGSGSNNNPFGGSSNPFGNTQGSGSTITNNPFGGGSASSNRFNGAPNSMSGTRQSNNPFGSQQTPFGGGGNSNPFGRSTSTSQQSGSYGSTTNKNPFGGPSGMNTTPFGTQQPGSNTSNASPFSSGVVNSSPFGVPAPANTSVTTSLPFTTGTNNSNPFGTPAPAPTPFGTFGDGQSQQQQQRTSFGAPQQVPFGQQTPFGSPFGGNNNNSQQQQTSFGGGFSNNNAGGGGKGKKKPPCKFYAQGKCRYGNNCRFSHEGS